MTIPVTATLAIDSGSSPTDSLTNDATLRGTGSTNAVVTLSEGAVILGTVLADVNGQWSFTPTLADGAHSITASETDAAGNTSSATIDFTLDTAIPVLATNAPSVTEAASAAGAAVSFAALATDLVDGTDTVTFTENGSSVTPGITVFSLGSHVVAASATDRAGNTGTSTIVFNVVDTTAPVVAAGAPSLTEATSAGGSAVTFAASAVDTVSGAVPVVFSENGTAVVSGGTFAIGQHTVVASATDAFGNLGTSQFTFDVVDTTAPVVTAAAPASTEATTAAGASVAFTASSTDVVDGSDQVTFSENGASVTSGGTFAVGHHTIVASAADAAGNTGQTSFSFDVVDTAPPAVTASAPAATEATSADGAPVTFAAAATDAVDGTDLLTFSELGTPVASGATFSIGHHTIVASATDAAGNIGTTNFSFDVVDTTPPAVTAALAHDTGASSSDRVTSDATISGTGDASAVVTLKEGAAILGTTIADGTGAWSFTPTLVDGVHTITARETDKSGNTGTASLTITVDTKSPAVKAVLSTDTGSSATDGITNTTTIFGAGDPNALVTLTEGGTTLGTATADPAGNWRFTPNLTDGPHTITARETDAAGNTGSGAVSFTLDTQAPVVTIDTPVTSTSNSGMVTASGTAEASSVVTLLDGGVTTGATTASTAGIWTLALALASGTHTLTATATDTAGNASAPATTPSIVVAAPLTTPDLTAASDKGISSTDNITNVNTPVFTGSGAEAGATVKLFDTNGTTVLGTTTADALGNWTVTTSVLADGSHDVTARQTDAAGRTSTPTGKLTVTIDTVAPKTAPTTPDLVAASDSGISSTDNITNVSTPVFTGTAEVGTTVQVMFDGGAEVSSITVPAGGVWTTPASVFVPSDGTHTVFATAMDVAGNISKASANLSFILDRVAPTPPAYATMTANANGSVSLTGTAEASTSIAVFDGTQIGTTSASASGAWSFTTPTNLANTLHVFVTRATDAAGNVGAISGANGSAQFGSTGVDTLRATSGKDLMTGGAGADTFSFLQSSGIDIITDFTAGAAHDVINFHANTVLKDFTAVLGHAVQSGSNVVISQDASDTLTLKNVTLGSLTAADFSFA